MKLNVSKNANYLGWIIIIIAFGFLYFSYFFIYIPRQETQLQQRAFRILKEYGNNMFDKNSYFKNHFKNYKLYYSIRHYTDSLKISEIDSMKITDKEKLKEIKDVIGILFDFVDCGTGKRESIDSVFVFSKQDNKLFINYSAQLKNVKDTELEESLQQLKNYYIVNSRNTTIKDNLQVLLRNRIMYKVPVEKLMEGLKFDQLFENILLFDKSTVYYNTKLELVSDITQPKALCDSVEKHQGGIWETMDIRGKEKQVMVLPADFLGKRFYFAGIISDTEYKTKTRTIDNQFLILIAVVLLLILIGMPVLKILFIGKDERLKSTDASSSLISSVLGTGLLIIMVIGIIKFKLVDHPRMEDRLVQISDTLYKNVTTDINKIRDLYKAVFLNDPTKTTRLSEFAKDSLKNQGRKFHLYPDSILDDNFKINEIILINKKGIVARAVTSTKFSELMPVNLSQRQYFQNAYDTTQSWPTNDGLQFYIESIKSYNTGAGETSVSFHNQGNDSFPVAAITSAIPSLYNQVLPKDVEFLIINSNGKVLYHSIKSKNLHENFLDECDFNPKIKNAMDYRTSAIVSVEYNEKDWLARIIPIEDTPLFHVTLVDLIQYNNKNARIFLFTFYFLIVTLIVIGMGMLILKWVVPTIKFEKSHRWFLSWILFEKNNFSLYAKSALVLLFIVSFQLLGLWIMAKPTAVLLYHVIFISFTSFTSLVLLKRKELNFRKLLHREYFPENVILIIVIVLSLIYISNFNTDGKILIPLAALLLLTLCLPVILKLDITKKEINHVDIKWKRRIYLHFIFLWLVSLSAIPVVQFYFSIKYQEELIWQQQQYFTVAQKNLDLYENYGKYGEKDWLERIQGNGIDHLSVDFVDIRNKKITGNDNGNSVNLSDRIYAKLPDPVTNSFEKTVFVNDKNYENAEWIKNDTLFYSRGGSYGAVSVVSKYQQFKIKDLLHLVGSSYMHGGMYGGIFVLPVIMNKDLIEWNIIFYSAILLIAFVLWILLKYIASVILNLNIENPKIEIKTWEETVLKDPTSKRYLLQSFYPEYFLKKTEEHFNKNEHKSIILVKAGQIANPEYDFGEYCKLSDAVLWIRELDQFIYDPEKHEMFIARLSELNNHFQGKIVVELPFDLDFIDEVYNDYIADNELEKDKKYQYLALQKRWKPVFRNYTGFNGFMIQKSSDEDKQEMIVDALNSCENEIHYSNIWNNLTNYEKIVLFDLADDGLVNIKNKSMINQLIWKGLITLEPYPKLLSDNFRDYIIENLSPGSVKAIESKLGFKGKWKNTRYLILLILIPLAAFILISQGMSIEKIFGIFAGIITVITGAIRLFDSNIFKSAS